MDIDRFVVRVKFYYSNPNYMLVIPYDMILYIFVSSLCYRKVGDFSFELLFVEINILELIFHLYCNQNKKKVLDLL